MAAMEKRSLPSPSDWEAHKNDISGLYCRMGLGELMKEMESKGFYATRAVYKKKFRDWGLRKYVSSAQALTAHEKKRRREEEGHPVNEVVISGMVIPNSKIQRHVKRHKAVSSIPVVMPAPSTLAPSSGLGGALEDVTNGVMPGVIVRTPVPSPAVRNPESGATRVRQNSVYPAMAAVGTQTSQVFQQQSMVPLLPIQPSQCSMAQVGPEPEPETMALDDSWWSDFFNLDPITYNSPFVNAASPARSVRPLPAASGSTRTAPAGRQQIHQAAKNGHLPIVKALLRVRSDCCDLKGPRGETPLSLASEAGHVDVARVLLEGGANPSVQFGDDGRAPIHQASQGGHLTLVQLLLDHGAEPNFYNGQKVNPLMLAAEGGHRAVAEHLLSKGADPNFQTPDIKRGPLHQAAQEGHQELVELLLKHNAKVDAVEDDHATPLWLACQDGHLKVAELLIKAGADVNAKTTKWARRRPIHQAAQNGHTAIVQLLVDNLALIDVGDNHNVTALRLACQQGHKDIAELLLTNNANPNNANPNNRGTNSRRSPLHKAAQHGHVDVVRLLIRHGGQVNNVDIDGRTPLMLACLEGHLGVIELLIESHADIHIKEKDGATALLLASQEGHVEIVDLLLVNGAKQTGTRRSGRRPIHQAAQNGHLEVVKLLKQFEGEIDGPCRGNGETQHITPLWLAAQGGHEDVLLYLLENGAKPVIGT